MLAVLRLADLLGLAGSDRFVESSQSPEGIAQANLSGTT